MGTSSASRLRRALGPLVAVAAIATALVVLPTPVVVEAKVFRSTVRTEHVTLSVRRGLGTAASVAPAVADEPDVARSLAAPSRRRAIAVTPFDALGVTLAQAPGAPILVRARVRGRWTPWSELEFVADEAPDQAAEPTRAGAHSEAAWFGGATAYEIDAPPEVATLAVHLVSDRQTGVTHHLETSTAGALGAPSIAPRAAWGARAPKATPTVSDELRLAVVHHSDTSNTYSAAQVPAVLRSIQAYHQDVQGWDDIAYNFAVDRFGRVWEARAGGVANVVLGGHSRGFNTSSVGVVVLGDFTSAQPTAGAVEAVARVIAWKFAIHHVDPASTVPYTTTGSSRYAAGTTVRLPRIVGHRDVQTTSCPGSTLYARLGTIRQRVAQLVPQYQDGMASHLIGLDVDGHGYQDALEHRYGPPSDMQWKATGLGTFYRSAISLTGPQQPVVGDFDGDGRDDLFWYGSGSTADRLWWSAGEVKQIVYVEGSFVPKVGDFDGDGRDDILWYSPGISSDAVWYGNANRTFTGSSVQADLIGGVPVIGDFDGDGRDDVLFYGRGDSEDAFWWSTGRGWVHQGVRIEGQFAPVAVHDGSQHHDEILFVPPGGTSSWRWAIQSGHTVVATRLDAPGIVGAPTVGDLDGDGLDDVLFLSPTGSSAIWFSTQAGVIYRRYTTLKDATAAVGRMELTDPRDELLVVSSSGADELWSVQPDRTLTRRRVG